VDKVKEFEKFLNTVRADSLSYKTESDVSELSTESHIIDNDDDDDDDDDELELVRLI
jgi:hypothetical protein